MNWVKNAPYAMQKAFIFHESYKIPNSRRETL
jgi:hypothetical protein